MVVLPGGMPGAENLYNNMELEKAIAGRDVREKWIAAICAAPMILGKRGYLRNKEAVCYPGFEKDLYGAIIKNDRVIISENYITSKGPGTALDFALAIVSVLKNEDTAQKLRTIMQAGDGDRNCIMDLNGYTDINSV
jgi:4-methyl-5(b-hydroxyethyl)-thiazole monophosphate biosynthesis